MATRQPVLRINSGGVPMDTNTPPPPPPSWFDRESGLPNAIRGAGNMVNNRLNTSADQIRDAAFGANRAVQGVQDFITGLPSQSPASTPQGQNSPTGPGAFAYGIGQRDSAIAENQFAQNRAASAVPTFAEFSAAFGGRGGGGGASRPDFSAYRQALTDQAGGINAQIQAMYNQLGEQAGANVSRLEDIYSGAGEGINAGYDAATSNIQQAFGSAQQQAADQMSRLGIEDAAGQVLPSQALAQAQAISSLEQGRGSGLSANERFGSSAGGFASQMAQTAQQQGTEMNSAILASLQNRLAESLAAEQSGGGGGGGGGGGMSVSDQLRLREAYNQEVGGQIPLDERKFAFEVAKASAGNDNSIRSTIFDQLTDLTTRGINGKVLNIDEARNTVASNLRFAGYADRDIESLLADY